MQNKITITNPKGIHARPSTLLVQAAARFTSRITLQKGSQTADAGQIMSILMLAAMCGDELLVTTDGDDEAEAMQEIKDIFARKFGE